MDYKRKLRTPHKRHQATEIDVDHVIRYLSRQFRQRTESYGRFTAVKGTELYDLQVNFSYLLDSIKRGPTYHASKVIAITNDFLDKIKPSPSRVH